MRLSAQRKASTVATSPTRQSTPPCISCGGPLTGRDHFCPSCGRPRGKATDPSDLVADQSRTTVTPDRHFACSGCGAEVVIGPEERSLNCPFCDTAYVAELPATPDRPRPEFVIGFSISRDQALAAFRQWIKENSWFRPGDLPTAAIEDKLRGMYLPFWSFAARADTQWTAQIGEYWYETQTYTTKDSQGKTVTRTRTIRHTEWWPLSGRRHQYWTGYFLPAGRGITREEAQSLMPFRRQALARFRSYFLAGWLCEECVVPVDDAWNAVREIFAEQERQKTAAFMPGDTHSNLVLQTRWQRISEDLVLLPVHIVSYRYHDQVFRFLINGQTGKFTGQKPVSKTRISIAVAIFLVIALVIFLLVSALQ